MNRDLERILYALASLGLAAAGWIFGLNLLPTSAAAQEEGIFVPWLITWGMILLTTASAVGLAAFLVLGRKDRV